MTANCRTANRSGRGQRDVAQLGAPRGERGGGEPGLARGGDEPVTPHGDGEVRGRRGGRDQRRPQEAERGRLSEGMSPPPERGPGLAMPCQLVAGFPGSAADARPR